MSVLAAEYKAINLSQGFPNYEGSERLKQLVTEAMNKGYNQYAPMAGLPALNKQLALKIESIYNYSINPSTEITITAGATQAIFTAITAMIHPGDEVILFEPAYDCYRPAVEVNGGKVLAYSLQSPDYKIDWSVFEAMLTDQTKMIIINNPHNPSGKILKKEDFDALQRILANREIVMIFDEVYEHLTFDGQPHLSVIAYPELYQKSFVTFSFGKTFHYTGWKTGFCAAPEFLTKEFRKVHQYNVFSVNTPVQYALAEFLKKSEEYEGLSSFFQEKRDFFANALSGSRFELIPCEGTYFQLVDYSRISNESEVDFSVRLTKEFGVGAIPVSVFYHDQQEHQVVRLCFAKTEDTLEKAAEKLIKI